MTRVLKWIEMATGIMFLILLVPLVILSFLTTGKIDQTLFLQHLTFVARNPLFVLFGVMLLAAVLYGLSCLMSGECRAVKKPASSADLPEQHSRYTGEPQSIHTGVTSQNSGRIPRRTRYVIMTSRVITAAFAFFWIHINTYYPTADQRMVWEIGTVISSAKALTEEQITYMIYYPHQKQIILFISALVRLFGTDPLRSFAVFNILCLVLAAVGVSILSWKLFRSEQVTVMTSILLTLFLPLAMYSTYIYGTLPSLALAVWGFYGAIRILGTGENVPSTQPGRNGAIHNLGTGEQKSSRTKEKWKAIPWIIFTALCYTAAIDFYRGTVIAFIAAAMTLLLGSLEKEKKHRLRITLTSVATILLVLICMKLSGLITDTVFEQKTGIPHGDGIPTPVWIDMGIAAADGVSGPGSHDESDARVFEEYDRNYEEINRVYTRQVLHDLKDYVDGDRDPSFFFLKTKYQWMDPWFSAAQLTIVPSENAGQFPEKLEKLLSAEIFGQTITDRVQSFLAILQPLIYLMTWLGGFLLLRRISSSKRERLEHTILLLPEIYFIGGFIFQFFWESKARYCMPYFVMLIPLAAYGITCIQFVKIIRR